jgi:hypothetical protein
MALSDECDLEEHEALVNQLQDQKALLETHVGRIDSLLQRMKGEAVNGLSQEEDSYFPG